MNPSYIVSTICCLIGFSLACDESLLIVGGQDESGPLASMHLLTPSGWCQDFNFPPLPEPVSNPGVHVFDEYWEGFGTTRILIVCGFTNHHCRWTFNSSTTWNNLPILFPEEPKDQPEDYVSPSRSFQMLVVDDLQMYNQPSLIMVSTKEGDNYVGNTHINNLSFRGGAGSFYPPTDETAEFSLSSYGYTKNITGSCLTKRGNERLLIGGRTSELHDNNSQMRYSDAAVGRMSPDGSTYCDSNVCYPKWESYVVPDLNEKRDEPGCFETNLYGDNVVIVGGGINYYYIKGKSGMFLYGERTTYETLKSVEVLQDNTWISGPSFNTGRVGFSFMEMCGENMALGGRIYDGEYIWENEKVGGEEGEWVETVTDNIRETYLDSIETLRGISWVVSDMKMPKPMANFGVARVPSNMCTSL